MSYGIDVSYCQEGLDYTQAVALGYKFCIVRLGYTGSASGRQALDDLFVQNINAAKAAGMEIGIYFYSTATSEEEAEAEADWLLDQMNTYLDGVQLDAGIWYDVEEQSQKELGYHRLPQVIMAFMNRMNAAGKYVGLYAGYDTLINCMDTSALPDYIPLWVSIYDEKNYYNAERPNRQASIWQYTDSGFIGGVQVDLNYRYND